MENSVPQEGCQSQHPEDSELENASGGAVPPLVAIPLASTAASDLVLGTDTHEKAKQGFSDLREGDVGGAAWNMFLSVPAINLFSKLFK